MSIQAPEHAKQIFSPRADVYAKGRPGYAPELTDFLREILREAEVGADIGSGTGIFTRELLGLGKTVYAVEPNEAMRSKAEAALAGEKGFLSVPASGEDTGLADESCDFVTCASSFHWLHTADFRRECLRILRPGAPVFVLFNERTLDDPFTREQDRICRKYCPRYTSLAHGWQEASAAFPDFFGEGLHELAFDFPLPYTRETFLTRSLSSSYSPAPKDPGYAEYKKELEALFDRYAQGEETLLLGNYTRVGWGMLR